MKGIIKELLRESLLSERLMDISSDVDAIYEKYFMSDCDAILKTGILRDDMFRRDELNTSDLTSPLALKAHAINPCVILINDSSNFYHPNKNIISFAVSRSATNFIKDNGNSLFKAQQTLINDGSEVEAKRIAIEFDSAKVKGSIHHELVHWLDDTLHNKHITKTANASILKQSSVDSKGRPRYLQPMEIQALIHNVLQLKRENETTWDDLSFEDMINLSPPLQVTMKGFTQSQKVEWKNIMLKRMYREGLMGKNMR